MGYPQSSALRRQCPDCSGVLLRKTVDSQKPLGAVACSNSNCQYSASIGDYVREAQADIMARAQERLDRK